MDSTDERIDDSEVLLRRVPPSSDYFQTICERADGGFRATSPVMSTRNDEDDLSCSRLRLISPQDLLNDLRNDGKEPRGWHVCRFLVSDVKELGLEIAFTPTERDPGHCSITSKDGLAYPNNKAKKLARQTKILTDEEINTNLNSNAVSWVCRCSRFLHSIWKTFITSSPRWLITFTAIRPLAGFLNGRDVSLLSVLQASSLISAFSVVFSDLYGSFAPRK